LAQHQGAATCSSGGAAASLEAWLHAPSSRSTRATSARQNGFGSLGFARFFQLPAEGDPGYVGLRRGVCELAVVASDWPQQQQYGLGLGNGPRFEMCVYVDDVDKVVAQLRAESVKVLKDPADMPSGERMATIPDPDGNPVALCNEPSR
jgi:lactoylglutathione lyase